MAGGELLGEVGGGEPEEAGISGNLVVLLATIVMSWNWITLDLFREEVDHDVSNSVPRAVDSATAIRAAAAAHAALLPAPEDSSAIEVVLGLLAGRA